MKKILGSILLISLTLFASNIEVKVSKNSFELLNGDIRHFQITILKPYRDGDRIKFSHNESNIIELTNINRVYKRIGKNEKLIYNYRLDAKGVGEFNLDMNLVVEHLSDEQIKESTVGLMSIVGEEKAGWIDEVDIENINIKINPSKYKAIGEYKIEASLENLELYENEPNHLNIKISGEGNFSFDDLDLEVDGVHIFSSKFVKNLKPSKNGFSGDIFKSFALSSKSSYNLPTLTIKYLSFDNKTKELIIEPKEVNIRESEELKYKLLDKDPNETTLDEDIGLFVDNAYEKRFYFLVFIIGVLIGYFLRKVKFKKIKKDEFIEKVSNIDDSKTLLAFLLANNQDEKYNKEILLIEENIYKESKNINISKLKREVINAYKNR